MGFLFNLLSVLYLLIFAASGFAVARLVFSRDRLTKQVFWGLAAGLVMLLWFPTLFAFIMDFTLAAQLAAAALAVGVGVLCLLLANKKFKPINRPAFSLKDEKSLILAALPLIIIGTVLICNHTITNAENGSLHVGQSTYGDLSMHLGFISSISVQKTFPPMYSILPDTQLGYPFLCDSVSSTFYTLGASLRFATILPAVYAYIVVVLGVYLLFEQWFKRNSIAVLATYLFFIGGGFGFAYFFDNTKTFAGLASDGSWSYWLDNTYHISANISGSAPLDRWNQLINGWYETPTNFVELGLRWVNPIADMIVPQRATLFGWALLFPSLQLLYRAAIEKEYKLFIPLGIIAGAMPLVHTHSFLALGIISVFLIIAMSVIALVNVLKPKKDEDGSNNGRVLLYFLLYGVIAAALAAPQLLGFTFKQSSSGNFVRFYLNWCNESDGWLWFYIKNLGLIFILMPMAFLSTKKQSKLFYGGALLIWLIAELFVFQPNTYDNNKLLFVWFALTCGIVAEYLVSLYDRIVDGGAGSKKSSERTRRLVPLGKRIAQRALCIVVLIVLFLSGAMTLLREYVSADHIGSYTDSDGTKAFGYTESGYELVSADLVDLTEYVKQNTPTDAIFLTATNHNNAIAMLTGRSIVCGASNFLYYHGVDYTTRYSNVELMYEQPETYFDSLAKSYSVSYVLVGPYERGTYSVASSYFAEMECVYSNSSCRLYRVTP